MTLEEKIHGYQPSEEVIELVRQSTLLLVAGIVSAGKDTLVNSLIGKSDRFSPIISHTTRLPRKNHGILEQDGVDYHFISLETAEAMVDNREFIEAKYVHGNVYGTSASELRSIKQQNNVAITDIDIQGVDEYMKMKPDAKAIFLLPPSVDTWVTRLEKRYGTLDIDSLEIQKRFVTAAKEIEHITKNPNYIIVINDDIETTTERVNMILEGERDHSSDFAEAITGHLLEYIESATSTH